MAIKEEATVNISRRCPKCGAESPWTTTGFFCFSLKCNGHTEVPAMTEDEQLQINLKEMPCLPTIQ